MLQFAHICLFSLKNQSLLKIYIFYHLWSKRKSSNLPCSKSPPKHAVTSNIRSNNDNLHYHAYNDDPVFFMMAIIATHESNSRWCLLYSSWNLSWTVCLTNITQNQTKKFHYAFHYKFNLNLMNLSYSIMHPILNTCGIIESCGHSVYDSYLQKLLRNAFTPMCSSKLQCYGWISQHYSSSKSLISCKYYCLYGSNNRDWVLWCSAPSITCWPITITTHLAWRLWQLWGICQATNGLVD